MLPVGTPKDRLEIDAKKSAVQQEMQKFSTFLHHGGTDFGLHSQSTQNNTVPRQDSDTCFANRKEIVFNTPIAAILVFTVGVGAVLVVRSVTRRLKAYADAMIVSFGLPRGVAKKG